MGISTVGLLQDVGAALLAAAFGDTATTLKELTFGGSSEPVGSGHAPPKSLGHEVTFASDVDDPGLLRATLLDLSDAVMADLRCGGYATRTVTLKLRYEGFQTISRQVSLPAPARSTKPVYEAAAALLGAVDLRERKVRLLGVSVSNLTASGSQLSLDDPWREIALDEAVDRVRGKYGALRCRLDAGHRVFARQSTREGDEHDGRTEGARGGERGSDRVEDGLLTARGEGAQLAYGHLDALSGGRLHCGFDRRPQMLLPQRVERELQTDLLRLNLLCLRHRLPPCRRGRQRRSCPALATLPS
jgi:hypothetical protein